jgi:hypothetical protein
MPAENAAGKGVQGKLRICSQPKGIVQMVSDTRIIFYERALEGPSDLPGLRQ